MIQISIKKENHKPSILKCTREDGTFTYSKIQNNFEIHDITHYVVEKQLQLKNAFYGLLSQGYQISDFMLPKDEKPEGLKPENLLPEALATEHLVNLLTLHYIGAEDEMDIAKSLNNILNENGLSFGYEISSKMIISMQQELTDLMDKWNKMATGKTLQMILNL